MKNSKWPERARKRMIEKSNYYEPNSRIYKFGFYDGFMFCADNKTEKTKNQLHLFPDELNELGFIEYKNSNETRLSFKKDSLNGYFYYNPLESKYVWYHKVIIGDGANHTLLDIRSLKDLQRLLRIFRL